MIISKICATPPAQSRNFDRRDFARWQKNGPLIFPPLNYSSSMRILFALSLLLVAWLPATAAEPVTVQEAIKLLSREQARNLVRIEAREGTPAPDRWYIQVYDPTAENGLREFVVFEKAIVAKRTLSQFLDGVKPEDVVGAKLVRVDSDDLIKIIQKYVEANNLNVTKINYTMAREATNPAPVWEISCFDDSDKKLGELVINARNANVLSHDGFDVVPGATASKPAVTSTPPQEEKPPERVEKPAVAIRTATAVRPDPSPATEPGSTPKPRAPGGFFHRIFSGKSTPTPAPPPSNP
jgi:hypothetical protein